jgi:hypothetical protein
MPKTFALDYVILTVGDTIIHRNLRYSAVIKSLTSRGNGTIEIPDTAHNSIVWDGCKLPLTIKVKNIVKTFRKQPPMPKLEL